MFDYKLRKKVFKPVDNYLKCRSFIILQENDKVLINSNFSKIKQRENIYWERKNLKSNTRKNVRLLKNSYLQYKELQKQFNY